MSCVARIKNSLAYSTHQFFQNNGFLYIHTPVITAADCEGAGEMFQVTTLLPENGEIKDIPQVNGKIDYTK
jgi:asparaginyl-tRNA synthetase